MDYARVYRQFIADRRAREPALVGYAERHHILPRSLGGEDGEANIICLAAGDHLFAHLLLWKIHGGPMAQALMLMLGRCEYQGRRSRYRYDALKRDFAAVNSELKKGHTQSAETRAKRSMALRGNQNARGAVYSADRLKRLSTAMQGNQHAAGHKRPPEVVARHAAQMRGNKFAVRTMPEAERRARSESSRAANARKMAEDPEGYRAARAARDAKAAITRRLNASTRKSK